MLIAMTRVADRVGAGYGSALFYGFFLIELFLFTVGAVGTERGYFGPQRHPVNRMFTAFSWVAVLGLLATMVVQGSGEGNPLWLTVLGGASMFTGGMAAALLAVSASPWRDLLYSRRFEDNRPVSRPDSRPDSRIAVGPDSGGSHPVPFRDDPVHGVPREQP